MRIILVICVILSQNGFLATASGADGSLDAGSVAILPSQNITAQKLREFIDLTYGGTPLNEMVSHDDLDALHICLGQMVAFPVFSASAEAAGLNKNREIIELLEANREDLLLRYQIENALNWPPAEENLRAMYKELQSDFQVPETLGIRHIFWQVNSASPEERWKKVESDALEIHKRLEMGESFESLAREVMPKENYMQHEPGEIVYPNVARLNPIIRQHCDSLTPGKFSKPFRTPHGVEILFLVERTPGRNSTYEETRDFLLTQYKEREIKKIQNSIAVRAESKFPVSAPPEFPEVIPDNPENPIIKVGNLFYSFNEFVKVTHRSGRLFDNFSDLPAADRKTIFDETGKRLQWLALAEAEGIQDSTTYKENWDLKKNLVLAEAWLNRKAQEEIAPPDDKTLQEWFNEKNRSENYKLPELKSGWELVISWGVPLDATHPAVFAAREQARTKIDKALAEINDGTHFSKVVRKYATSDKSRQTGGRLELLDGHSGSWFDTYAKDLPPGKVSEPVVVGHSWAIYLVDEIVPGKPAKFEDAKADVARDYRVFAMNEKKKDITRRLAESMGLKILPDETLLSEMHKVVK